MSDDVTCTDSARRDRIFHEMYQRQTVQTDRRFAFLMIIQWVFGIICAVFISPRTWYGAESQVHLHVWAAVFLGGILNLFPAALAFINPGQASTRHVIAFAQMLVSALLIHLTGGRIETHFHIFGSLAFLTFYRDWRVLMTASAVVAVDHYFRGRYFPESIFGVSHADNWRWLEHTAWVIFEDIFLGLSCVAAVRDLRAIANRRALQEETNLQVENLRQAAEAASRAKSTFLANMSHEIRTPLGVVLGFSQLLNDPKIDKKTRDGFMAIIKRNGAELTRLIDDIIDLSKVEAERLEIESAPFSLRGLLTDIVDSLGARAREKKLDLRLDLDPSLPNTIVSDRTRLRQVLVNLIGNAIKFTEKGGVLISATATPETHRVLLQFVVKDSGPGIAPVDHEKIFEPFVQADASTTRKFGGAGLGLALSRKLAQNMGGDLTLLESVVGGGSSFALTVAAQELAPESAGVGEQTASVDLSGLKILVAEDAHDNRLLLQRVLSRAGAALKVVENGAQAVAAAQSEDFDIILMDIQMPVLDGIAAVADLRNRNHHGPIIALTAHAMLEDREKCLAAGFSAFLTKPIQEDLMLRTIAQHGRPLAPAGFTPS